MVTWIRQMQQQTDQIKREYLVYQYNGGTETLDQFAVKWVKRFAKRWRERVESSNNFVFWG